MANSIVSVIVPVYNVELYIEECINSVLSQTYDTIEIIVIDDCGIDNSILYVQNLISSYRGEKSIQIVTHDHNRGLSASRNTGLAVAKGDYVFFLDSDDWIYPNCIKSLVDSIEQEEGIDYAIGDYEYDSQLKYPQLKLCTGVYSDNILSLYTQDSFYMMAWNKLYRKDFLTNNNLSFREGLIHEDLLWSYCCACVSTKIAVIKEKTLYYRIRENSIQTSSDFAYHYFHYYSAFLLMLNYTFDNELDNNLLLFSYLNKQLKQLFLRPFFERKQEHAVRFYLDYRRNKKYWSLKQICSFTNFNLKRILIHFHWYLPNKIGFLYFKRLFIKFYDY